MKPQKFSCTLHLHTADAKAQILSTSFPEHPSESMINIAFGCVADQSIADLPTV
jgi:hypothetical protein